MYAFTIIMIVVFSLFDLAILIGIFKERDDAETILSALIFFLILNVIRANVPPMKIM